MSLVDLHANASGQILGRLLAHGVRPSARFCSAAWSAGSPCIPGAGGLAGGRLERPFCFTIACGRRHSAVATFGGAAYAWGRDVALPAPPPAEARKSGRFAPGANGVSSSSHVFVAPVDIVLSHRSSATACQAPSQARENFDSWPAPQLGARLPSGEAWGSQKVIDSLQGFLQGLAGTLRYVGRQPFADGHALQALARISPHCLRWGLSAVWLRVSCNNRNDNRSRPEVNSFAPRPIRSVGASLGCDVVRHAEETNT